MVYKQKPIRQNLTSYRLQTMGVLIIFSILCCIATVPYAASQDLPSSPIGVTEILEGVAYNDDVFYSSSGPTPQELAENEGCTADTYDVTTEDGYILQMHRITGTQKSPASSTKTPVLLIHGLWLTSAMWVIGALEESLGFIAADNGFDVWLGNTRGNRYARNHTTLTVKDKDYWMFGWHEMGMYDVPAMIDFILAKTGKTKLIYTGFSQGATVFFVMATMRPEYQDKVSAAFALGPTVFMGHATLPLMRILAPFSDEVRLVSHLIGLYELMPTGRLIQQIAKEACGDNSPVTQEICATSFILLFAPGEQNLNKTLLSKGVQYTPGGASVRQPVHFGQLINKGNFQQYDYGPTQNMEEYGSPTPPEYPLDTVQTPVRAYYGANDGFANPIDVKILCQNLSNCTKHMISEPSWTHLDFFWGKNMRTFLYDKVIEAMILYR